MKMCLFKYADPLFTIAYPLFLMFGKRSHLSAQDYLVGLSLLSLQLLLTLLFYKSKNKWGKRIEHSCDNKERIDITKQSAIDAFLLVIILIFGVFLPYGLYIPVEPTGQEVILIFVLFFILWMLIFQTPLYLSLIGYNGSYKKQMALPFLTIGYVLFGPASGLLHFATIENLRSVILLFFIDIFLGLVVVNFRHRKDEIA